MKKLLFILLGTITLQFSKAQAPINMPDNVGGGNCLEFNLIGTEVIDCGSNSTIDNVFAGGGSVSSWFKPYSANGFTMIVSKMSSADVGWAVFLRWENLGMATVEFVYTAPPGRKDRNYISSNPEIVLNEWNAVTVVYDSDDGLNLPIIYVNGIAVPAEEDNSPPVAGTMDSDAGSILRIGNTTYAGATRPFDGQIDEISLWNRALNEVEIRENMCRSLAGNESGLVGYWNMNEGEDNTCNSTEDVCDLTGNGNHGTLQ